MLNTIGDYVMCGAIICVHICLILGVLAIFLTILFVSYIGHLFRSNTSAHFRNTHPMKVDHNRSRLLNLPIELQCMIYDYAIGEDIIIAKRRLSRQQRPILKELSVYFVETIDLWELETGGVFKGVLINVRHLLDVLMQCAKTSDLANMPGECKHPAFNLALTCKRIREQVFRALVSPENRVTLCINECAPMPSCFSHVMELLSYLTTTAKAQLLQTGLRIRVDSHFSCRVGRATTHILLEERQALLVHLSEDFRKGRVMQDVEIWDSQIGDWRRLKSQEELIMGLAEEDAGISAKIMRQVLSSNSLDKSWASSHVSAGISEYATDKSPTDIWLCRPEKATRDIEPGEQISDYIFTKFTIQAWRVTE